MSKPFQPTAHPVLGLPTPQQAVAMGEARWRELMIRREEIIRGEKADLFRNCWEPPIWKVADALMGFPWVDPVWAERMRLRLGFKKPTPVVLVNGGNRGGKSQWGSHRAMKILRGPWRRYARAWALHSTLPMSRQYQQPLFYDYLPPALKGQTIKSQTTYIAYKQKTGFSEEQFVLPPQEPGLRGSDCVFKAYEQEKSDIEGGNLDFVWPDELVPADWIETLEFRIAEKQGWMPITFTPVNGYNDTVKMFQDGAETVMESVAFLLPKDGGPPDVARALGLTDAELAEVQAAAAEGRAALYPQSRPEDCNKWLEPGPPEGGTTNPVNPGQLPIPAGREFETVPRVMKCLSEGEKRAVVFFYSSDNPFGNPKEIANVVLGKPAAFIKERFYGLATKHMAGRFPKFNRDVHTCAASDVPSEGTNYQFIDPCSGRNFYMLWIRVTPEQVFVYREWPGPYYIEGIGVPGPWALPDPKKADGRPGPAQDTFGWGYRGYKLQIAELEKWKDLETRGQKAEAGGGTGSVDASTAESRAPRQQRPTGGGLEWIDELDEHNGSAEMVRERKIDARFASAPKMENDRPKTMLTDFEDIGLYLVPARGDDIAHGVQCINDLLHYDAERPVDYFNKPKLMISRECPNLIFALQTWTGKDGQKGATKDPVETLYRFATDDCPYLGSQIEAEEEDEESDFEERPRNHY